MLDLALEERELLERINWFIKLRWLAGLGVIGITFFSNKVLSINFSVLPIYLVSVIIFIYNLIFLFYGRSFIPKKIDQIGIKSVIRFANVQIVVDLFAVALLVHLSGGVENPFIFYFIFHMIISSILLSTTAAFYQATLAVFLFGSICFLEYSGIIPHIYLEGFAEGKLYRNIHYILGTFFVFTSTMYISVYIITSVARKLRRRQRDILVLKEELEEKNKTLLETQEILIQQEKMSSLGQMAASVAHEINNPLTGILIYIRILLKNIEEKKTEEGSFKDKLTIVERESERMMKIVKNLLGFARQSEPHFKLVDLNEIIEKALSLLEYQAKLQEVTIVKELKQNLPKVNADFEQIQQVFVNIILNGIQVIEKGGILKVTTGTIESKGVFAKISDTGCGISEENMKKLFTPFFTTKEKGKGVGLGLAVCYGIIKRHNGKIEVKSEVEKGTTFTIKLGIDNG